MSSIITAILRSTVGLLCDKARDSAADKLKDGDLTDESMRQMIVKDLTDIKSKLDNLSLKDLNASCSFLKEGVELLNLTLDQSSKSEDEKASEDSVDEATRVVNCTASGILNAALSLPQAIQRLNTSSNKRFVSAQDCFKASRETATHAFNNEFLSIKDRIMACKLRIAARILESGLEDPEAATAACLLSLEELHRLPAIKEMCSVFLKGGWKSKPNKSERLDNMMSVLFINHALYDFASKYSSKSRSLLAWPGIKLKHRPFHPILDADEVTTKTTTSVEFFQQLKQVELNGSNYDVRSFAINGRGDIILLHDDKIAVIYSTDESKNVVFPETTEKNVVGHEGMSVAVDSNNNVYAVRRRAVLNENGRTKYDFVLYAFDENYNIKNVCVLDFLDPEGTFLYLEIAVDQNQNLIMITNWNNQVYVCDNTGKLKSQFPRDASWLQSLSISNNNDVMIVSDDFRAVHTYSTDGNLKSTIKPPDGHVACSVAFHHGIGKIIVLTYVKKEYSYFLLSYSETRKLEDSVFFRRAPGYIDMTSHPDGPVAVMYNKSITFI